MARRLRRRRALPAAAAVAAAAVFLTAVAWGEVVQVDNIQVAVQGNISPSRLPKTELAPTSLELQAKISTTDHTRVPITDTIAVESNRHGAVETKGIPTCSPGRLENTLSNQAEKICGKALVGTGSASAEIAFPEQPPFNASGPMLIFNGTPKGGKPVLVIHVHANVPAPTTFVTTGVIEPTNKGQGPHISFQIPSIVDGQGSLTGFKATLHRVIRANCPAPAGLPGAVFPFAKSTFTMKDGRKLHSVLVRQCKVRR